jgi:hypothetical protein
MIENHKKQRLEDGTNLMTLGEISGGWLFIW